MRTYLINLGRRPDRLAAMTRQTVPLGLSLERIEAVDAQSEEPGKVNHWFTETGPLGEIPQGDKACLVSHRLAWEMFLAGGESHAVFLEDDVRLSASAGALLTSNGWIPAGVAVVKLEHYGPPGQRVLLDRMRAVGEDFRMGRMLSRHTGAAAYILSRRAAELLLRQTRFDLPVDHLLFNPNNSKLFDQLAPWQLLPAIARQEEFVGEKSDIEGTRLGLRAFGWTYVKREAVRFGYDLKLLPRQIAALMRGAKFVAVRTTD
jgi:glycosyl transferase family 25